MVGRTLLVLLIGRPLLILLIGRTLLVLLIGRTLLVLLIGRTLLVLLIGRTLLVPFALLTGPLLHLALALLHLRVTRAHLLTELILLIARQLTHQLPSQIAAGAAIGGAPFGMRLRILMDERLNPLLLIA